MGTKENGPDPRRKEAAMPAEPEMPKAGLRLNARA
jgi:hypothetical protein